MALLPVILVVSLALFPKAPPIHVERFATEGQCREAAAKLDGSTPVILILRCEVTT